MLETLAKHAGVAPVGLGGQKTVQDRAQLRAAGVDPGCCEVPRCTCTGAKEVKVHHIVRKATRIVGGFDIHAVENLVLLCRHHHGIAGRLRPAARLLRTPSALRPWLIETLAAADAAPPPPEPQERAAPRGRRRDRDTADSTAHA